MKPNARMFSPAGWRAEYIFLSIAGLLSVIFVYGQLNLNFIAFFSNAITPFEAFAAFAMAALLFQTNAGNRGGGMSRVYASYSLGMFCWFVAETTWSVYTIELHVEVPFPSIADLFWLIGYVPLLVALMWQALPFREAFSRRKQIALSSGMCVMAAVILSLTIPSVLQQSQDSLSTLVSVAYPVLDTLLLSAAVPALILFRRGIYWRPMLFVILGIMFQLIGDLVFAQSVLIGTYYSGGPDDLMFDWSYLLLALGFYKALNTGIE